MAGEQDKKQPMQQTKEYSVNEFIGGLDFDTAYLKVGNNNLVDSLNIRLVDEDGQGLIVTNIKGNEKRFELTSGFIPLGYCEYNGVAFIFSHNPISTMGEIGTFPSPCSAFEGCYIDTTDPECSAEERFTKGFTERYSPLKNFVGSVSPITATNADRISFRHQGFAFDCEHQIEAFARIDYDKTVNLYFTDNNNPIRKVNCGFDIEGRCMPRFYGNSSFPNEIALFSNTCSRPIITLGSFGNSGELMAGNWIFYFKYTTEDLNSTDWMGESSMVQISPDDAATAGAQTDGASGEQLTTRSVTLLLSNIDVNFKYIEVGFVYFYEGVWQSGNIDKLYGVDSGGTASIEINGTEDRIPMDVSELFAQKQSYDVAKTICQFENRLFAANLRANELFDESMPRLAKEIMPKFNSSRTLPDQPFTLGMGIMPGAANAGEYKDPALAYNGVGYFRGETYAFAVVYVFSDGKESQAFPVRGIDDWGGAGTYANATGGPFQENEDGIYRFPNAIVDAPYIAGQVNLMGIQFNVGNFLSEYALCPWMQQNVCGMYFTRAKRNENLEFQGVAIPTITPSEGEPSCSFKDQKKRLRGSNSIPMFQNITPFWAEIECSLSKKKPFWLLGSTDMVSSWDNSRYGIYGIDHFIKHDMGGGNRSIMPIGTSTWTTADSSGFCYNRYLYEQSGIAPEPIPTFFPKNCYHIEGWDSVTNNGFQSMYSQGKDPIGDSWYYAYSDSTVGKMRWMHQKNLAFGTTDFYGIDNCSTQNFSSKIVNVYRTNPDPAAGFTITNLYQPSNEEYYKIGDFNDLTAPTSALIGNIIHFRGDCFLQRYYMKQLFNSGKKSPDSEEDGIDCNKCEGDSNYADITAKRKYGFGLMFSVVTENSVNSAMRQVDAEMNYFPEYGLVNPADFAIRDYEKESRALNYGYNETESVKSYVGYDDAIPFVNKEFPTRIIYSRPNDPNSFGDAYTIVDPAAFKDFDYRLGHINKILDFNSRLMSIQDTGVNYHLVNERAMLSQPDSGSLLLGAGNVLDKKAHPITDMLGSQHQWSICKSDNALYGVDYNKRKIWRIQAGQKGGLDTISDSANARRWITEVCNQYGDISDRSATLADNPICQEGILTAFDKRNNEIIFTFLFNPGGKIVTGPCDETTDPAVSKTLVFNEWMGRFTSERSYKPNFYMTISEDFYSINPALITPIIPNVSVSNFQTDFYLHDVGIDSSGNDNYLKFYGVNSEFFITFVINQAAELAKVFDNIMIASNGEAFKSIEYLTEDQVSLHSPFVDPTKPYINPSFRENYWKLPVSRATSIQSTANNIYSINSRMRGKYMVIKLVGDSQKMQYVKSVITGLRNSKS
jgi:hypothetical protein